MFNYQEICQSILKDLPEKQKEIIIRRFGLWDQVSKPRETLESIGKDFCLTRERIRQIEEQGLLRLRTKIKQYSEIFQYFADYLKTTGNLRREDILLSQLGGEKYQPQIFFLLTLDEQFKRFKETEEFYSFWTTDLNSLAQAKKIIQALSEQLKKTGQLLSLSDCQSYLSITNEKVLEAFIEISKIIQKNPEGLFGLREWPEVNPRGVRDKAYLVFKKIQKPLHFTEVARLINELNLSFSQKPKTIVATVHNELIRDPRFVLVGRGLYALREWGYVPGTVREIIIQILKESGKPLTKEEILEKVLEQRWVQKNTVLLNLQDRRYFLKDSQGKYTILGEA